MSRNALIITFKQMKADGYQKHDTPNLRHVVNLVIPYDSSSARNTSTTKLK